MAEAEAAAAVGRRRGRRPGLGRDQREGGGEGGGRPVAGAAAARVPGRRILVQSASFRTTTSLR